MGSFEDRLLALSNAATLKKAKALLKQQNLIGAWRQPDGRLHGIFRETAADYIFNSYISEFEIFYIAGKRMKSIQLNRNYIKHNITPPL